MTALRDFLAREVKTLGYRGLSEKTGISRGALESLIKPRRGESVDYPKIETLIRISKAYHKPLWEVMQMAEVDLDLPQTAEDVGRRLAQLIVQVPRLAELFDRIMARWDTDPEFVKGFVVGLEARVNGQNGPRQ